MLKHDPFVATFHQFSGIAHGPNIISSGQLEAYMNNFIDRMLQFYTNGQRIKTTDGFQFPVIVWDGLVYL